MKKILLLLPSGCELLEAAAFTDVFGWNETAGSRDTMLVTAGPRREVAACFGRKIQAQITFDQVDAAAYDAVALPGGFPAHGYFAADETEVIYRILRDFHVQGKFIAGVCTGSLLIARAGLLIGRHATVYQGEGGRWQIQLADAGAIPESLPVCVDGNVITADGPSSAVLAAFALLGTVTDRENALNVAAMMGYAFGLETLEKKTLPN